MNSPLGKKTYRITQKKYLYQVLHDTLHDPLSNQDMLNHDALLTTLSEIRNMADCYELIFWFVALLSSWDQHLGKQNKTERKDFTRHFCFLPAQGLCIIRPLRKASNRERKRERMREKLKEIKR